MLAVNRDQHWPLTAWLAMITLRFLHRLPGTRRREQTRGGAIVLLFGQVFTLNRYPGGNSRKPHHIAEEAPKELAGVEGALLLLARVTRQLSHLANAKRAALPMLSAPNWEDR